MLPYEYSVLLKTFKKLGIPTINVYLEASSVEDDSLNGTVHRVKYFFNKRFYKYTEHNSDSGTDDLEAMLSPSQE